MDCLGNSVDTTVYPVKGTVHHRYTCARASTPVIAKCAESVLCRGFVRVIHDQLSSRRIERPACVACAGVEEGVAVPEGDYPFWRVAAGASLSLSADCFILGPLCPTTSA